MLVNILVLIIVLLKLYLYTFHYHNQLSQHFSQFPCDVEITVFDNVYKIQRKRYTAG